MPNTEARKLVAFAAVFTVSDVGRSLEFLPPPARIPGVFPAGRLDQLRHRGARRCFPCSHLMPEKPGGARARSVKHLRVRCKRR